MRSLIFYGTLAVCLTAALALSPAKTTGLSQSRLIEQTIDLKLEQGTLLQALSRLVVRYRVPIGYVPALGPKKNLYVLNIDLKQAPLKVVLDTIVQQLPEYRWEVRDDVINIVPTKSKDELVEELLSTPVQRFVPPQIVDSVRLRDAVIELPEVQAFLKAKGLFASRYGRFERYSRYSDPNDLRITNTDVRGVLNKIVRESEYKWWILSRSGKDLTSLNVGI